MTPLSLSVADAPFGHALSFALLFVDHFTQAPVAEELTVVVDGARAPVSTSDGHARNGDGTYRFIDLSPGNHLVSFQSQSGFYQSFDPPLSVSIPLADLGKPVHRDLWPTPMAPIPAGVTAIAGSLVGNAVGNVRVEIQKSGDPFDRFTFSDARGQFLFLIPGPLLAPASTDATAPVTVRLGGGAIVPSSIAVLYQGKTTTFSTTQNFAITQGARSRVTFTVP